MSLKPRTWRGRIAFSILALIAIALIYPGIPAGSETRTVNSRTEAYTHMICWYLRWNGIHTKVLDIQHERNQPLTITDVPCRQLPFG